MKAGKSSDWGDRLAQAARHGGDRVVGLLIRRQAANHLHQLHHRHRIHEMHADEAFRPVGNGRQAGDRDGGGVGRDDCVRFQVAGQVFQDGALGRLVLGRRLDDDIARLHRLEAEGRHDARQGAVDIGIGNNAAPQLALQVAPDGFHRCVDRFFADVVQDDVIAVERRNMRDAVAHLAGADDAYFLDRQRPSPFRIGGRPSPGDGVRDSRRYLRTSIVSSSADSSGTALNRSATRP